MKASFVALLSFLLFLSGCKQTPEEFSYTFVMESAGAYKLTLTITSNKRYTIQEQYIYFEQNDKNYKSPDRKEGIMSDKELAGFGKRLKQSRLFEMKDSYGFNEEGNRPLDDVFYHIIYRTGEKEKSISVKWNNSIRYPVPFVRLIKYTNKFISKNKTRT